MRGVAANAGVPLLAMLVLLRGAALAGTAAWRSVKSLHFVVYHQDVPAVAARVVEQAEQFYARLADGLDMARHRDFWTWERRVTIRVYGTRAAFTSATGAPVWASGKADYAARTISTCAESVDFKSDLLPHEIAHLAFRDFAGFKGAIPLWLDEGVAEWAAQGCDGRVARLAAGLLATGRLSAVESLTATDVRGVADPSSARAFYIQAASLVSFLIQSQGAGSFRRFCGHLRDGKPLDDALRFTYPDSLRSIEALDKAWRARLREELGHE